MALIDQWQHKHFLDRPYLFRWRFLKEKEISSKLASIAFLVNWCRCFDKDRSSSKSLKCCVQMCHFTRIAVIILTTSFFGNPSWKTTDAYLSERLVFLGITGDPWNLLDHHRIIVLRGLRESLNFSPIIPREAPLSRTTDCNYFQSQFWERNFRNGARRVFICWARYNFIWQNFPRFSSNLTPLGIMEDQLRAPF